MSVWRGLLLGLLLLPFAAMAQGEQPRVSYMLHCMGCHRLDGSGMPPDVPRLTGRVGRFLGLPGGRGYLVQVPGAAQSLLDDRDLAGVLNWIVRELGGESVPPDFVPYTAAEVGRYRQTAPADIGPLARRLAERLAAPAGAGPGR